MSYYAVKAGHTTGIFDNWTECQKATKGYSGPVFKKFGTLAEAEAYLNDVDIVGEAIKEDVANDYVVAFCDGSYDKERNRYSFGVFIVDKDFKEYEVCGSARNAKYTSSNNIIGEVLGVINAMDWAVSNGHDKLKIYHDYEGLSKWLSGEWAAKSDVAKMFVSLYNSKYAGLIHVDFQKVKGHSNNKYNDKADELAKRALSDNARVPITGDSWFTIPYFKEEELQAALDLMSEEYPDIKIDKSEKSNSIIYKLALNGNRLSVTLFNSSSKKLLVQGANTVLFQIFITYINELIGVKEERIFADAYRKSIDKDKIDNGVQSICPVFPADYPENIKRLIRQAIINLNYFVECEDYSQYVFPALRALEGHMKYLFGKSGIIITSKQMFGCFEKNVTTHEYYLPATKIADAVTREKLERYYNYYNATRHTLFHFGDIIGATDSTRIMGTKDEADEQIKKCLSYICEE